jgi:hypothetical protein
MINNHTTNFITHGFVDVSTDTGTGQLRREGSKAA